jgi:uncharacterized protein
VETKRIEIRTLVVCLAAVVSVELAVKLVLPVSFLVVLGNAADGLVRLIQISLIVWIVGARGAGIASIGLDRSGWVRGIKRGLLWSFAFGFAALCAAVLLSLAGMNVLSMIRAPLPRSIQTMALYFLVAGIVGPVAEEIFFRGLLYGFFRRYGVLIALILSTALFIFAHPLRGLPLTQIVGGLVFALAYEVEGNLLVPISVHVLGNLAIFTLSAM